MSVWRDTGSRREDVRVEMMMKPRRASADMNLGVVWFWGWNREVGLRSHLVRSLRTVVRGQLIDITISSFG